MSKLAGIFGFVGAGTTLNVGHRWKETRSCASVSVMEEWHGLDKDLCFPPLHQQKIQ